MDHPIVRRHHSVGVPQKRHKLCWKQSTEQARREREGVRPGSIVREVSSFVYVADTHDLASCSTLSSRLPLIITPHHSSPDTDARVWQRPRADPVDFWHRWHSKSTLEPQRLIGPSARPLLSSFAVHIWDSDMRRDGRALAPKAPH